MTTFYVVEYADRYGRAQVSGAMPRALADRYAATVRNPVVRPASVSGEEPVVTRCEPGTAQRQTEAARAYYRAAPPPWATPQGRADLAQMRAELQTSEERERRFR